MSLGDAGGSVVWSPFQVHKITSETPVDLSFASAGAMV